jgi:hypothetical protein
MSTGKNKRKTEGKVLIETTHARDVLVLAYEEMLEVPGSRGDFHSI